MNHRENISYQLHLFHLVVLFESYLLLRKSKSLYHQAESGRKKKKKQLTN